MELNISEENFATFKSENSNISNSSVINKKFSLIKQVETNIGDKSVQGYDDNDKNKDGKLIDDKEDEVDLWGSGEDAFQ